MILAGLLLVVGLHNVSTVPAAGVTSLLGIGTSIWAGCDDGKVIIWNSAPGIAVHPRAASIALWFLLTV